ncbi:MAG: hypothetical protein IJ794_15375 [Lachnospiraceae bacterium]|nr:hypothetical protein [Lachnospiraceae bacterium]
MAKNELKKGLQKELRNRLKTRQKRVLSGFLTVCILAVGIPTVALAENDVGSLWNEGTQIDRISAQAYGNTGLDESESEPGEAVTSDEVDVTAQQTEGADTAERIATLEAELRALAKEQPILALVYLNSYITIYEDAAEDSQTVVTVPCGQTVMIEDAEFELPEGSDTYNIRDLWLYVSLYDHNTRYHGFVAAGNIVTSDERFLEWQEQLTEVLEEQSKKPSKVMGISTFYPDIEQFPDSYKEALVTLKEEHPSWIFVPMNTGLDWNTVIANEIIGGKSLVHYSLPLYYREGSYDNSNWYYSTEAALRLYMDPRNSLKDNAIFQFEQLTYNESYHTEEALNTFLQNTFMNNSQNAPGTDMTFARIIQATGAEKNVSPYHLASRIYQEQGAGTSPLISGSYPGYEGYYNYFNVGASGESDQEYIENGLRYAKEHEWNNAYYSIYGGADTLSRNYIGRGQDTLYLQKYNVTTNSTYSHQYMQNISAPTSEAANMRKLYDSADALESIFVFKIPVYENMPDEASPVPTVSTNVVLKVPDGYDSTIWLDGVEYNTVSRNGYYIATAPNENLTNAVVYQYNSSGIPVGMYLWTLQYTGGAYVVTEQPALQNLLTYHGFSIRIVGKSGIRIKTGISADLKAGLTGDGVNGYKLKEYGTLVMNNANRAENPMVKGATKVAAGVSYGTDTDGSFVDKVYETVDGRDRFTAVLVGLPAEQYKTEFAFRGYAVLEKDGVTTTVYGPIRARSIYQLAEQILNQGTYSEGSAQWNFLKQLINDAPQ